MLVEVFQLQCLLPLAQTPALGVAENAQKPLPNTNGFKYLKLLGHNKN